jgi:tol-pal system protein YbgF
MRLRVLLLAGLCLTGGQAHAGLFNDDEARQQILQVATRVSNLEESGKQQAEAIRQQTETSKQQTSSMLDLQTQIETQNSELQKLRGQNEELVHNLQDAEKRQKDFYIDLDSRLRHFEELEATAPPPAPPAPEPLQPMIESGVPATDELSAGNRAYEAAHGLFKADKHQDAINAFQDFLNKFPESVYVPNAYFEMGVTYFALKDYKKALDSYQVLVGKYSFSPKLPDAMLGVADCQTALKDKVAARKILKQILALYPGSEIAAEAKKRLAALK